MKTVAVNLLFCLVAKSTLMRSLQKATNVIADMIISSVAASRFLAVTLIVKGVLVAQKKNAVVTKVGMVTAMGIPVNQIVTKKCWSRIYFVKRS